MMVFRWKPYIVIATISTILWAVALYFISCAPKPRFVNGDPVVLAPDVVEPDMPQFHENQR